MSDPSNNTFAKGCLLAIGIIAALLLIAVLVFYMICGGGGRIN